LFYKGKRVLVTGGTGFVGLHIVLELLKQGAKVRVPLHNRPLIIQDENIEIISVDLSDQNGCLKAADGVDYVFHAAGAVAGVGLAANGSMAAITTNLILTSQMLQASWTARVKRFLLFSSSTGYPVTDHPVQEDEMWSGPTHPNYFGYGWMRRYFERLGEFVASSSDLQISIIRPTAVYGQYDNFDPLTSHVIPALIRKAVERQTPYEVWGSGEEARDFLHVSDLARGCLLMLEKNPACDPVNIGYGQAVKIKDIVHMILKAAGHNQVEVIFNQSKPTTIPVRAVNTDKARTLLGFEPQVSLEDGLRDTLYWYAKKEKYNLTEISK